MSDIEEDEDTSLPYGAHPVSLSRKTQERLEVILTTITVTIVGNVTFVILHQLDITTRSPKLTITHSDVNDSTQVTANWDVSMFEPLRFVTASQV